MKIVEFPEVEKEERSWPTFGKMRSNGDLVLVYRTQKEYTWGVSLSEEATRYKISEDFSEVELLPVGTRFTVEV
jgi:hypothetical protein